MRRNDSNLDFVGSEASEYRPGGCQALVLGASNLALGLSALYESAQIELPGPVEILCVGGHGRSYGASSRALLRKLPGVLQSEVWQHLRANADRPRYIVLTDIGNDLMYGRSHGLVLRWVEQVLDLCECGGESGGESACERATEVVLVLPPMQRLRELSSAGASFVSGLFFPTRGTGGEELIEGCLELSEGLWRLAEQRQVLLVEPERAWYGVDPIHIRRSARRAAWRTIFSRFDGRPDPTQKVHKTMQTLPLIDRWSARPEQWALGGIRLGRKQPIRKSTDGAALWLF